MKKLFILLILILPFLNFAAKIERNALSFRWDYTLSPVEYHQAEVEKVINTHTIQILYQGTTHIMNLTGELDITSTLSPDLKRNYPEEGKKFLEGMCPVGQKIYITFDAKGIDANGIVHGYIWYKSGETWILHNLSAIANGYALADRINVYRSDYQDLFTVAEQTAKDKIRGIWKSVYDQSGSVVISYAKGPVRISQVQLIGEEKYIEITNTDSSRIDITGWKLLSKADGKVYSFANQILTGGKKLRLYLKTHKNDLVWNELELYYYRDNSIVLLNGKNEAVSMYSW
jgi:endonuclease YncB( thermonuclease family)